MPDTVEIRRALRRGKGCDEYETAASGEVASHYIDVERMAFGAPLVFAAFIPEVSLFPPGCVSVSSCFCIGDFLSAHTKVDLFLHLV